MYQLSLILLIPNTIKAYGLAAALLDIYTSLFDIAGFNIGLFTYTLVIEGLFVFLKSAHFHVPEWFEALEDVL